MTFNVETAARVTLALMMCAAVAIGIPFRLRADRAGGRVSARVDPKWFWYLMAFVGPAVALTCFAFIFAPRRIDFALLPLPAAVRLIGAPAAIGGVILFAWMFRHLGLNVTSTSMPRASATLVTSGPYRWIRHPMYSAALILVIAAALLTASLIVAVGGVLMFVLLATRSRIEEQRLVEKFGPAYETYQRQTGRFIPRVVP
jgi:protein-S-isoprenylcysteine O-methyltransferase Ste14